MLYSWEEVPEWDDEYYAEILELNSDTLKMTEYGDIWVLIPYQSQNLQKLKHQM